MATSIVLTIIGEDRTGIVSSLSGVLAEHGGNWIEGNLNRLAGQFAGVVMATLPDERVADCLVALDDLASQGLTIISHTVLEGLESEPVDGLYLELVGNDTPGIVREVTEVFRRLDVSLNSIETRIEPASMAGGELFRTRAVVTLPDSISRQDLRAALEEITFDLMVEFPDKTVDPQ